MKRKIMVFVFGALSFIISQPLIRMPLLNYLQMSTEFVLLYTLNPLLIGIVIAFSAGVFEETTRFIFKYFFLRAKKPNILEPIIFGLGHGIAEALIILLPFLITLPIKSLALGILERFLAIILHIGLTVIVWNGFQRNKKWKYLLIAIFVHGSVNSLIPILSQAKNYILIIEASLAIIDIFIIRYIYKSRKNYNLGGEI